MLQGPKKKPGSARFDMHDPNAVHRAMVLEARGGRRGLVLLLLIGAVALLLWAVPSPLLLSGSGLEMEALRHAAETDAGTDFAGLDSGVGAGSASQLGLYVSSSTNMSGSGGSDGGSSNAYGVLYKISGHGGTDRLTVDIVRGTRALAEVLLRGAMLPGAIGHALCALGMWLARDHFLAEAPFRSSAASLVRDVVSAKTRAAIFGIGVLMTPLAASVARLLLLEAATPVPGVGGQEAGERIFCHSALLLSHVKLEPLTHKLGRVCEIFFGFPRAVTHGAVDAVGLLH